jgi:hypothetical protein
MKKFWLSQSGEEIQRSNLQAKQTDKKEVEGKTLQ